MLEDYIPEFNENRYVKYVKNINNFGSLDYARRYIQERTPKESYFQKRIINGIRIAHPDAFVIKIAQGPYSHGGFPDVFVLWRGTYFGFEVKRPIGGRISRLQEKMMQELRDAGGVTAVVRWPEEALHIMENNRG